MDAVEEARRDLAAWIVKWGAATENSSPGSRKRASIVEQAQTPAGSRHRLDYNHVRPHSAHAGLTPNAVRLIPAAGRLRNTRPAAQPLRSRPAATVGPQYTLSNQGLSQ